MRLRKLYSVTVELKVLTPIFTYGDKNKCEFRLTELKSLMRTIFREFFEFKNLEDMKEQEGKIFGNLIGKAPVSFKMVEGGKTGRCMLIHHKENKANAIKENGKISFEMISWDKETLDLYCQILLLSSVFGSIGKRARKGLGSFRILSFGENADTKYSDWLEKEPFDLLKEIKKDLNIRNFKEENEVITFDNYEDKSLDFPYVKKIKVMKLEKINESLLEGISKLTHLKVEVTKDKNKKVEPFKNDIENSRFVDNNILGNHKSGKSKINRFASPICISFLENNNSKYLVLKILNYDYFLLELYLSRKEFHLKRRDEFIKIPENNKNQKYEMIEAMKEKETKNFVQNRTNEVKKFKTANIDYINKYIKEIKKIGGGTWQSYSE